MTVTMKKEQIQKYKEKAIKAYHYKKIHQTTKEEVRKEKRNQRTTK